VVPDKLGKIKYLTLSVGGWQTRACAKSVRRLLQELHLTLFTPGLTVNGGLVHTTTYEPIAPKIVADR